MGNVPNKDKLSLSHTGAVYIVRFGQSRATPYWKIKDVVPRYTWERITALHPGTTLDRLTGTDSYPRNNKPSFSSQRTARP
jgi:hypothetical protein